MRTGVCWGLLLVLAAGAWGQELSLNQATHQRPLLRRERPPYRNYAFNRFTQYPEHTWGSPASKEARGGLGVDRPHAFWSPLGDYLMTGYDLFTWVERRQPEQRFGSALFKDWAGWAQVFDHMAVGRDGYGGWGYSVIVGDGLIARFTPLTLSKTDFYGARLDVALPYLKFTALGSRIARPNRDNGGPAVNHGQIEVDLSTLLVGGRAQADLGALRIGVNGVNLHAYNSAQPGNTLKGQLRQHRQSTLSQPLFEWLIVRVTDDAPTDGRGGAVIQEVQLIVNGQARPDLQAPVIRHRADVPSQVGRILTLTGAFLPKQYNRVTSGDSGEIRYYREREVPLYADYLYRLAHEAGEDVSKSTHLEGLLANFALEAPAEVHRVDGEEELVYLFDLSEEPYVESVEVEAVVGNDYRVEWAGISPISTAAKFEDRYRSTFYRTALRARGHVEDGSNLRRVRFEVGENTAIFTYSADAHLVLPWLEVSGEYARSAVYGRYPAHMERDFLPTASPRFTHRGAAYFANATHWFGRGRVGVEYFAMNPDFTTEMQTFLPKDSSHDTAGGFPGYSPYSGLTNNTMTWRLVQDNEDGDRWPDFSVGNILGSPVIYEGGAALPRDGDGVFPGQDADKDGIVDTDRNFNATPDYEETFLMYEVEPNEYAYGLDRNHNDEPDHREDDWEPDYPYDADQGGYHLFGQVDLSRHWSLGVGRYAVKGLASGGRNRSLYALLSYRREGIGRRLFFDHHFRRVEDDIPDEFTEFDRENRFVNIDNSDVRRLAGLVRRPAAGSIARSDLLFYQDSYVDETYLEGRLRPWSTLNLVQKLRLRLNWQQGGRLYNGRFQRERRVDFWSVVSRVDYTYQWGKLRVVPQFKFLLLRLKDQQADQVLRSEYRVIPILKVAYPLMSRTTLQAGLQGWGPLPYRVENRTQKHESFKQRTTIVSVINRSRYLGYDLHTIIGFQQRRKQFDDPFQPFREFDAWQFYVRGLVGFTEFGSMI